MEQPSVPGPSTATKIIAALLAGLIPLLLLFPASVATSDPPVCRSFFFTVPCEAWVSWAAAAATAGVVGLLLWRRTSIAAD